MILSLNLGQVDFSKPKVRVNGRVLNKFSLIDFMRHLDFKRFYWFLMYADVTHTYAELKYLLECYLLGDDYVKD